MQLGVTVVSNAMESCEQKSISSLLDVDDNSKMVKKQEIPKRWIFSAVLKEAS
jgi:hypothetical protein